MTIDKEFEAWALNHEIDITKNPAPSYDSRLYNDDETDNMWIGWQAARAIDAKRIAELEAKLNADFPLIVKLLERIDELEAQNKAMREVLQAYSENKKIGLAATCVLAALDKEGE